MPRLFIALDLPAKIKAAIGLLCTGLPGARWVPAEQLHLTLRFIGDLPPSLLTEVKGQLAAVRAKPFPLQLEGLGLFPLVGRPRVLWVGLKKSDALLELRTEVDRALDHLDIPPDKKQFAPHLTLARLATIPAPLLDAYLLTHNLCRQPAFRVNSFRLYSSILRPEGAVHTCEAQYLLRTDPREVGQR